MTKEQKESTLIFLKGMVYNTDYNNSSNHYYKDILNIVEEQQEEIEELKLLNNRYTTYSEMKYKNEYKRVLNIIIDKFKKVKHDYNLQLSLTYKRNKKLENQLEILEKIYEEINNE